MRNIVNERRVARGARIGKIGMFAGLGILGIGLVVSLMLQSSSLIWISFACLLLGFLVSSIGTANMNRWMRDPRADQALARGLKGFDARYRLYSYFLPAPHVLLSPQGLYVLTAMGQDGAIRYDGQKFHRDFSLVRLLRFMADEGLGKPLAEADAQVAALKKFLDEHDAGQDVEIQNMLIFFNPRAELAVSDPPRPMIDSKGLKKTLRKQQGKLSNDQYRQLREVFDQAVG